MSSISYDVKKHSLSHRYVDDKYSKNRSKEAIYVVVILLSLYLYGQNVKIEANSSVKAVGDMLFSKLELKFSELIMMTNTKSAEQAINSLRFPHFARSDRVIKEPQLRIQSSRKNHLRFE